MATTKKIHISIPSDLLLQLKANKKKTGTPVSSFISLAALSKLRKEGFK